MTENNKYTNEFDKRIEWTKSKLDSILPWLIGAMVALTSQWAAPAIQDLFEKQEKVKLDFIYIVIFFIFLVWFAKITKQHFKARTKELRVINNPSQCSHLILFLSTARPNEGFTLENKGLATLEPDLNNILKYKTKQKEQGKRIIFWAWEITLRAIHYHIKNINSPTLQQIIIVCSKQSLKQFKEFEEILNGYLKDSNISIKLLLKTDAQETSLKSYNESKNLNGIDFEDFDDLSKHLHNTINILTKQGIKREDIMIDFTSGQKVTSVVAATLTFNSNIKAQYISTETLDVKGYDIVYGTAHIPELS